MIDWSTPHVECTRQSIRTSQVHLVAWSIKIYVVPIHGPTSWNLLEKVHSGRIWNPDRGNITCFKLPMRLSDFVQWASALFCPHANQIVITRQRKNAITCVQNEVKISRVGLYHFKEEPTTFVGSLPASVIVSNSVALLLKCCTTLELLRGRAGGGGSYATLPPPPPYLFLTGSAPISALTQKANKKIRLKTETYPRKKNHGRGFAGNQKKPWIRHWNGFSVGDHHFRLVSRDSHTIVFALLV